MERENLMKKKRELMKIEGLQLLMKRSMNVVLTLLLGEAEGGNMMKGS